MKGRTIVLLRHGAHAAGGVCAGRRHDPDLSDEGRAQAADARGRLGDNFAALVVSPMARAVATASQWTTDPVVDERLAERDFGDWEGRPWTELWPTVPPDVQRDARAYAAFVPPGAETLDEVATRAVAAVEDVSDRLADGERALVVTHGGPLRLVVARLLGLPDHRAFALLARHGRAATLTRWGEEWTLGCFDG